MHQGEEVVLWLLQESLLLTFRRLHDVTSVQNNGTHVLLGLHACLLQILLLVSLK